jgi:hypothetical protein
VSAPTAAPRPRAWGSVLVIVIAALAVVAGGIHLTLGAPMFILNAIGYFVLTAMLLAVTFVDHPLARRFAWAPRVALVGYAAASIGAWLLLGGRYDLAYLTKGIELAIIGLLVVDILRLYRSPMGLLRAVTESLRGATPAV